MEASGQGTERLEILILKRKVSRGFLRPANLMHRLLYLEASFSDQTHECLVDTLRFTRVIPQWGADCENGAGSLVAMRAGLLTRVPTDSYGFQGSGESRV